MSVRYSVESRAEGAAHLYRPSGTHWSMRSSVVGNTDKLYTDDWGKYANMAVEKEGMSNDARGRGVLVAQEIAFAKLLAGNNKTLRDRGVKRLAKWLKVRSNGRCGMCAK